MPISRLEWSRQEQEPRHPAAGRRALAVAGVVLEGLLLAWLLLGSALRVTQVAVTGNQHLTAAEVRAASGLSSRPSVIGLDVDTIRRKLLQLPWVRAATVTPELPSSVLIDVQEWRAVAAYKVGASYYLLNGEATVLEQVPPAPGILEIDGPSKPLPHPGAKAIDTELLSALVNLARAFPLATGESVARFQIDDCGDLKLFASSGFTVMFGRVLTPEEFSSLQQKLDALAALRGSVDFASKDLDYVNVENPSAPAVHLHSSKPPPPSPGATPQASPSPQGIEVIGCQ
ncbi:MAG TPA: FtsQ-type POTRA domain-containing protein [Candidatus Dormibacteraeota bacterium]